MATFNDLLSQPQYQPTAKPIILKPGESVGPGGRIQSVLGDSTINSGLSGNIIDPTAAAKAQSDAGLSSVLNQYNNQRDNLLSSLSGLDSQKQNSVNALNNELSNFQTSVNQQKAASTQNIQDQTSRALSSAQDVQKANRNTLRGLGILGSSAAGELLSKPLQQFDTEKARLNQLGVQRINELDTSYNQALSQHQLAIQQLESQFNDLRGKIQNDLRFNDTQKSDAVAQATAAFQARATDIQNSLTQYQQTVAQQKAQTAQQLQALNSYKPDSANLSGISGAGISGQQQTPNSASASIYQTDPTKRGDLLSNNYFG